MNTETLERAPEQIEAEISATRQSLDRKLHELEKRISPSYRWDELRSHVAARLSSAPVATWAAVVAIVAGGWMALSRLRRDRMEPNGNEAAVDADMM